MKLLLIALATTVALPVFAGSLDAPLAEPPVEVSASKPVTPMRNYYGALSVIGGTSAANFTQDDDFPAQNGDLSFKEAPGLSGAFGYDYGNGLRVEVELMRLGGDTGALSFSNVVSFETDGSYTLTTGMVNGWYSFGSGAIRPFVGGGIGMMHADVDLDFQVGTVSGNDTVFAWQVGVGAEIPITDRMSILASYRYLDANGFNLADNQGTAIDVDLDSNIFSIGAMFRF